MKLFAVLGLIVFVIGAYALAFEVFKLLWNFVMPTFGLPLLSYWKAAAIVLLLSFIGGSFTKTK